MIVVFVGPSLPGAIVDGVEVRAPATRGDLLRAAEDGAVMIGLVDGVFGHRLAVSNAEVREVARRGVRLFGAASMGALRALECPDAMTGIGWVYEQFRLGALSDDDEVALTFAPNGALLTVPLVRVRYAMLMERVALDVSRAVVESLKTIPFFERTRHAVKATVRRHVADEAGERLLQMIGAEASDVKALDALDLLAAVVRARDTS